MADAALDFEARVVRVEDVLDDRKPQTGAAAVTGARGRHPVETFGESRNVLLGDTLSAVDHAECCAIAMCLPH